MTGGETIKVSHVKATPKAKSQFDELARPGERLGDVMSNLVGQTVRRFADNSPYFIHEVGPLRLTLCVAHGAAGDEGRMCVVTVQLRHRKLPPGNRHRGKKSWNS